MADHLYTFEPVGVLHSPYREKFGIPRQPGLARHAHAELRLSPPYNHPDSVRGLESFSHVQRSSRVRIDGIDAGTVTPVKDHCIRALQ
jgi:tRNA (Thr-GGU) A37 N-methylase